MTTMAEAPVLTSLSVDLLWRVAEELDELCLASFAAACSACRAAAQAELRAALLAAVKRCLGGAPVQSATLLSHALTSVCRTTW